MEKVLQQHYMRVRKDEYVKLKRIQQKTGSFFYYFEHLYDIKEAREQIKKGKILSQEKLFKKLGV